MESNLILSVIIISGATLRERSAYLDKRGFMLDSKTLRGDKILTAIGAPIALMRIRGVELVGASGVVQVDGIGYSYRIERIVLRVLSRTGGASWEVDYPHRMLRHAGEGGSHPHRWLAVQEARVAAGRLGAEILEIEFDGS
jgi:hypothetical protein